VLVDGRKLKRIAVTCKCGNRVVESVPGEVIAGGAHPVIKCDQCQQEYVVIGNKLRRFDRGILGKQLQLKSDAPVDAEFSENEPQLKDKKAWEMPASKSIQ